MSIKRDDILRIANYAHIQLNADEAQEFAKQLQQPLQSMEKMTLLDTSEVKAMINPHDAKQVLRDDIVTHKPAREELLANAPLAENGLFLVPRVIE